MFTSLGQEGGSVYHLLLSIGKSGGGARGWLREKPGSHMRLNLQVIGALEQKET